MALHRPGPSDRWRRDTVYPALALVAAALVITATCRIALRGDRALVRTAPGNIHWWLFAAGLVVFAGIVWLVRSPTLLAMSGAASFVALAVLVPFRERWLVVAFWPCFFASVVVLVAVGCSFSPRILNAVTIVLTVALASMLVTVGRREERINVWAAGRANATKLDGQLSALAAADALADPVGDAVTAFESARIALTTAASQPGVRADLVRSADVVITLAARITRDQPASDTTVKHLDDAVATLEAAVSAVPANARTDAEAQLGKQARTTVDKLSALSMARSGDKARTHVLADAQHKIKVLCTDSAGGANTFTTPKITEACMPRSPARHGSGGRVVTVDTADARDAVASVGVLAEGSDANKKALRDADAALAEARTRSEQPAAVVEVSTSITDGAEAVMRAVPPLRDAELPASLETIGWIVVAAFALVAYRTLQRRSAAQLPVSVTVSDVVGEVDKDGKPLSALFKFHVLRNAPEPASVPGATDDTQITQLIELAGGTAGQVLGTIVAVFRSVTGVNRSYVIDATYIKPGTPEQQAHDGNAGAADPPSMGSAADAPSDTANAPHRVVVRIQDATSKNLVAGTTRGGDSAESAIRAAGYWAAGWVLSRTASVPAWTKWNERTAEALAVYLDDSTLSTAEECQEAAKQAPDSGLLLTLLGHRFDQAGQLRAALGCYLRAATLFPRFSVARYRAAASMSMIACDLHAYWWPADAGERAAFIAAIQRLDAHTKTGKTGDGEFQPLRQSGSDDDARNLLCDVACAHLDQLHATHAPLVLLDYALDREERSYWLRLRRGEAERLDLAYRSAALITKARSGTPDTALKETREELDSATSAPESWQLTYNLACYFMIQNNPGQALYWLEETLVRRGSENLNKCWLETDPDLKNLRDDERFRLVVDALPPCEQEL